MKPQCLVGIDVGTSGVKVLALSSAGQIIHSAVENYPLYTPHPGWTEQEPQDWWQGTVTALQKVMAKCQDFQIAGISLSGQMHGMVALDADNNLVRRAILWNDQRTTAQCEEITRQAGGLEPLLGATNNQMLTGYTGGKILWLKQQEPAHYERTRIIINPKDYIRFLLTGQLCTDVSDASGFGFYDVQNKRWHTGLIERCGLQPDLFPPVVESIAQTGSVLPAAAEQTGLAVGTPVFAGGGDAVISTTGLGVFKPGRIALTLGTSGVVAMGIPEFMPNPGGQLQFFLGNQPGTYVAMGVTLAAAGSYEWYKQALGQFETAEGERLGKSPFALLDQAAAATPAGADGLVFLPYLYGERCPVNDPLARGGFIGLTAKHGKGHFSRAVLEGVAYSMRQVYELIVHASASLPVSTEIVLAGGGAGSKLWRQIVADVFQLPVRTVFGSVEGGSFGAALVAGVGSGVWPDLAATVPLIVTESETLPDPQRAPVYDAQYQRYIRLYEALKWSFVD